MFLELQRKKLQRIIVIVEEMGPWKVVHLVQWCKQQKPMDILQFYREAEHACK